MENEIIDKFQESDETVEFKKKKEKKQTPTSGNPLMTILNGEFLSKEFVVKNLGFIFYIIFLLILMVGKGYYDKRLSKEVDTSQKELDELTGDFVAKKAQLEEETKRITLVNELSARGLKETVNPTKVIRITKEN